MPRTFRGRTRPLILALALWTILAHGPKARADEPATQTAAPVQTSSDALIQQFATAKPAERKQLIQALADTGDPRLEKFFADFNTGSVYAYKGRIVLSETIVKDPAGNKLAPLLDPLTHEPVLENGTPLQVPLKELNDRSADRHERLLVRDALTLLRLSAPSAESRLEAVTRVGEGGEPSYLPALAHMAAKEQNPRVKDAIAESTALIQLGQPAERLHAAATLGAIRSSRALPHLQELMASDTNPADQAVYADAVRRIQHWQTVAKWAGNTFSGISAGSILVLMALGLAIVFGLMGVINMAHGELMMIGAYATYVTQMAFEHYLPASAFNWYFVTAIPLAFLASAFAGWLVEVTVVRHLYGRPLETLLATWGVGLVLTQLVRWKFGNNIGVQSPTWLRGGFEIARDITLPYNRCFIIVFCCLCVALMYFVVDRTRLGLLIRATTQNRTMAASLGVSTRKIDAMTFALGAGLAGLAGCALTLIGGVTPDMGQNYIVDSFLVVVTGGVGKLAGAVWAGFGLGCLNKIFEPGFGAVWGKVLVLLCVIAFIQKRPSGLFPAKGRAADV